MIWKITSIISLVFCVGFIIWFLVVINKLKRKYYYCYISHSFQKDQMLETKTLAHKDNYVFKPSLENESIIKKYALSYYRKKCYLIINYLQVCNNILMYVFAYNENEELIKAYKINESCNSYYSQAISLPAKTKYVNIVVKDVNDKPLESDLVSDYHKLIKIETWALFFGFYPLIYAIAIQFNIAIIHKYLELSGFFISLSLSMFFSFINYLIIKRLIFKRKSIDVGDYLHE